MSGANPDVVSQTVVSEIFGAPVVVSPADWAGLAERVRHLFPFEFSAFTTPKPHVASFSFLLFAHDCLTRLGKKI